MSVDPTAFVALLWWRTQSCVPRSHSCERLLGADQKIELLADIRQVLLDPKAQFLGLDWELDLLRDMLALRFLNVGHQHHRVLQLFDRSLHLFVALRRVQYFNAARQQEGGSAAELSGAGSRVILTSDVALPRCYYLPRGDDRMV